MEERREGTERVAENDVAEFVCKHGGQAGLIGKYVDQAAAHHDGVADSVGFQRRGRHNAAANFGFNIEIEPEVRCRSEEHLQSHLNLVCRLLLEKKKTNDYIDPDV